MRPFLSNILVSCIVFFIFISFFIINLNTGDISDVNIYQKNKLYFYLYDAIMFAFILLILSSIYNNGYNKGIIESLFVWGFLVIATPIPEAGLIVSLPLKRFFNFSMPIVQLLTSVIALLICILYYKQVKNLNYIGQIFNLIMRQKYYLIILVSIVCSIMTTIVIENIIDRYFFNKNIYNLATKLSIISVLIVTYIYLFITLNKL